MLQVHEFSTSAAESMFVTAINRQQDVIFDGCTFNFTVAPLRLLHVAQMLSVGAGLTIGS